MRSTIANQPDFFSIEHWNGTKWKVVSSPNPGSFFNQLSSVTAFSASEAWTVGYFSNQTYPVAPMTLIEHY
jgi:hypothetical protein